MLVHPSKISELLTPIEEIHGRRGGGGTVTSAHFSHFKPPKGLISIFRKEKKEGRNFTGRGEKGKIEEDNRPPSTI